jgi:hypothetical protein
MDVGNLIARLIGIFLEKFAIFGRAVKNILPGDASSFGHCQNSILSYCGNRNRVNCVVDKQFCGCAALGVNGVETAETFFFPPPFLLLRVSSDFGIEIPLVNKKEGKHRAVWTFAGRGRR